MSEAVKWMPKKGGKYYTITSGHVGAGVHKQIWCDSELDKSRYDNGNCFQSKKEAEFIFKSFHGKF